MSEKLKAHGFNIETGETGSGSMYLCEECGKLHATFTADDPVVMADLLAKAAQNIAPIVKSMLLNQHDPEKLN